MCDGKVEAWRVRVVARQTRTLRLEAAAWVDVQLTDRFQKRKCNNAIPQLVDEAIRRFDAELFAQREQRRADGRGVWLDPVTCHGLTRGVHLTLDTPDAELFDRVVDDIAASLKASGDTSDHQARRAKAVGTLLDPQLAMDFLAGTLPDPNAAATKAPGTPSRVANLYVHCTLDDLAEVAGNGVGQGVDGGASIEKLGPITLARLGEWLTRPGGIASSKIVVRPVIDTNTDQAVDQHDPPQWMREAMILRDPTCVFPGCTITARRADADHIDPYVPLEDGGPPGQTRLENFAPLCRAHHRLKTHTGWDYQRRSDGTYAWTDRWGRRLNNPDPPDLDAARSTNKRSVIETYLHQFLIEHAFDTPGGTDPPT